MSDNLKACHLVSGWLHTIPAFGPISTAEGILAFCRQTRAWSMSQKTTYWQVLVGLLITESVGHSRTKSSIWRVWVEV